MATTLEQDLNNIANLEAGLANNKVAQFAYTQNAYTQNLVDGTDVYNVNNENNIPTADASIMKVNETVLSKGYRSQASSITRMLLNHFLGRVSYNLNKANDLISSLVTTIKNNLGQANGLATLDANGRIPYSQLPESAIEFKGAWNAQTNTPTLADGTGTKGDFYVVSVAGTQNLGSGDIRFFVNDRVIYDGEVWQRLSAGDVKTVNSVQPVDGNVQLTPSDIGLGNVNNTSDADKPVSNAQREAISQAEANAKNLANATGKLDIEHGGTNATTTDEARTNLNINNVVNTGDSVAPIENGTTKFTTGGAYAELLKKANNIEGITAVSTLGFTSNADVFITTLINKIIEVCPRLGQGSIIKFGTDSMKSVNIVFAQGTVPSGAVRVSTSGLIILGNIVKMDSTTGNVDMNLILLSGSNSFFTCRVTQALNHTITASVSQSQSSLTFDSTPTANSNNPVTSGGIKSYVDSAIDGLDAGTVGGARKYIKSISETNGVISAMEETMDTVPTSGSDKAITSGAVYTAVNNIDKSSLGLGSVVNTGDSQVPVKNGTTKFTTGGAFNFFQTEQPLAWLGRVFHKLIGFLWSALDDPKADVAYFDGTYWIIENGRLLHQTENGQWTTPVGIDYDRNQVDTDDYTWTKLAVVDSGRIMLACAQDEGIWVATKGWRDVTQVDIDHNKNVVFIEDRPKNSYVPLSNLVVVCFDTGSNNYDNYYLDDISTPKEAVSWLYLESPDEHGTFNHKINAVTSGETAGQAVIAINDSNANDSGLYYGSPENLTLVDTQGTRCVFTMVEHGYGWNQYILDESINLWLAYDSLSKKIWESSNGVDWSMSANQPLSNTNQNIKFMKFIRDAYVPNGMWIFGGEADGESKVVIRSSSYGGHSVEELNSPDVTVDKLAYMNGVLLISLNKTGSSATLNTGIYKGEITNARGTTLYDVSYFIPTKNTSGNLTLLKGVGGIFFASTATSSRRSSYMNTDLYAEDN